jgi:hypothetical protein
MNKNTQEIFGKTIWLLWFQGWTDVPVLVEKIKKSWIDLNPEWNVVLLSSSNIDKYIDVKIFKDKMNFNDKTNIIKINILAKYGGIWADSSILCMMPVNLWIYDIIKSTGFWVYHGINYGKGPNLEFIIAIKQSLIIQKLKKTMDAYWTDRKSADNYLWLDVLFTNLYETDEVFAFEWSKVPYIWSESVGQSNMLVKFTGDIDPNLEYIIKYTPPYVMNLYHCVDTITTFVINLALSQDNSPYPLHQTEQIKFLTKLNDSVLIVADYGNRNELIDLDTICKNSKIQMVVYDKCNFCGHISNDILCRPLLNIGRDLGTFIYFVIEYYEALPMYIIFVPGNIYKHKRLERLEKIIKTKEVGFDGKLKSHADFTIDKYETTILEPSRVRPLKNWVEKFIEPWNDENNGPCWNGVMYTSKERILKHPKTLYINLINELRCNDTEVVHYLERVMATIF